MTAMPNLSTQDLTEVKIEFTESSPRSIIISGRLGKFNVIITDYPLERVSYTAEMIKDTLLNLMPSLKESEIEKQLDDMKKITTTKQLA